MAEQLPDSRHIPRPIVRLLSAVANTDRAHSTSHRYYASRIWSSEEMFSLTLTVACLTTFRLLFSQ